VHEEVYWVIYQAFVGSADSVGDDTTIFKSGLIAVFPLVGAHRSLTKSLSPQATVCAACLPSDGKRPTACRAIISSSSVRTTSSLTLLSDRDS